MEDPKVDTRRYIMEFECLEGEPDLDHCVK
jgi:hypothetical protein